MELLKVILPSVIFLFAHCILPYHTFAFTTFCLISFPFIMCVSPDGSSLSGHVSRCNLCERTSGCTQMTFTSRVEICWKPVCFLRSEALVGFEAPRATQMSLGSSNLGVALLDLVVGMATCWLCGFSEGQLPTAAALQEQGRWVAIEIGPLSSKNVRGFGVTKKKDLRIFDVRKWWSSDFIADFAMIEKDMIKALS